MTDTQEAPAETGADLASDGQVIDSRIVAVYQEGALSIPEAGAAGYEGILEQIMAAEDPAALDAPWRADGLAELLRVPFEVTGLRRMPSEFAGGLPFFLIVNGARLDTGELVTITTGSVGVVAQLVRAWQLGAIPGWRVQAVESERPSANGFHPQHLEVVRGRFARES